MSADLHCHTCRSDGALSPTDLVALATRSGLDVLAITDHDTLAGLPEARAAIGGHPLHLIAGVELTVRHPGGGFHLLGYFDRDDPDPLLDHLAQIPRQRVERAQKILARLADQGAALDIDRVLERSGETVGRPHIADALVAAGYAPNRRSAFERYLGDRRPAFVSAPGPEPREALEWILRSGGAPVLAHPYTLGLGRARLRATVQSLATAGLVGIEVHRPEHTPDQRRALSEMARHFDLVPCGGSDFHRPDDRDRLGETGTPPLPSDTAERLLQTIAHLESRP